MLSRLYNSPEAVLVKKLLKNYYSCVLEDDSIVPRDKFITFEEFLLFVIKKLDERNIPKINQLNILYAYEEIMQDPDFFFDRIYMCQSKTDYEAMELLSLKHIDKILSFKTDKNTISYEDYMPELTKKYRELEPDYKCSDKKPLIESMLKIREKRLKENIRFYDLYFNNLSNEQKEEMERLWSNYEINKIILGNDSFPTDECIWKKVFENMIQKVEKGEWEIPEINYNLYNNIKDYNAYGNVTKKIDYVELLKNYVHKIVQESYNSPKMAQDNAKNSLIAIGIIDEKGNVKEKEKAPVKTIGSKK